MGKFGIMGIHCEPYNVDDDFPLTNQMWNRNVGRITIRYCTLPSAKQINEVSINTGQVPQKLLDDLTDVLNKVVQHSIDSIDKHSGEHAGRNVNFIDTKLPGGDL